MQFENYILCILLYCLIISGVTSEGYFPFNVSLIAKRISDVKGIREKVLFIATFLGFLSFIPLIKEFVYVPIAFILGCFVGYPLLAMTIIH